MVGDKVWVVVVGGSGDLCRKDNRRVKSVIISRLARWRTFSLFFWGGKAAEERVSLQRQFDKTSAFDIV